MKRKFTRILIGLILAVIMIPQLVFALQEYEVNTHYNTLVDDIELTVYNTVGGGSITLIDSNKPNTTFPQLTGYRVFRATANEDWIFKKWVYELRYKGEDLGNVKGFAGYTFTNNRETQKAAYDGSSKTIAINRRGSQGETKWNKLYFKIWANFNPTITASKTGSGTITDIGKKEVEFGTNKQYTITADEHYNIKKLLIDGAEKADAVGQKVYTYTFEAVKKPHTISVVFEKNKYTVSFDPNGGSGIMESHVLDAGLTYVLPENQFNSPVEKQFKAWSIKEKEMRPGTEIIINDNITVKAVWKDTPVETYDLTTIVNGMGGAISPSKNNLPKDSVETVTVTPDAGYELDKITVNDVETNVINNKLNITMDDNKTVVATFKKTVIIPKPQATEMPIIKSPQTGDNSNIGFMLLILSTSFLLLVRVVYLRKKRLENN